MNKKYIDFVPRKTGEKTQPVSKKKDEELTDIQKVKAKKIVVPTKKPATSVKKEPTVKPEKTPVKVVDKTPAKTVVKKPEKEADKTMKLPVAPKFMNAEKVDKRPLSKNVYKKKIVVPEEKPSKPVTIIDKPEKDSKVWLVVTIIITIILGAAAGTVAFLLLPK
jgi:hypothetical protein